MSGCHRWKERGGKAHLPGAPRAARSSRGLPAPGSIGVDRRPGRGVAALSVADHGHSRGHSRSRAAGARTALPGAERGPSPGRTPGLGVWATCPPRGGQSQGGRPQGLGSPPRGREGAGLAGVWRGRGRGRGGDPIATSARRGAGLRLSPLDGAQVAVARRPRERVAGPARGHRQVPPGRLLAGQVWPKRGARRPGREARAAAPEPRPPVRPCVPPPRGRSGARGGPSGGAAPASRPPIGVPSGRRGRTPGDRTQGEWLPGSGLPGRWGESGAQGWAGPRRRTPGKPRGVPVLCRKAARLWGVSEPPPALALGLGPQGWAQGPEKAGV